MRIEVKLHEVAPKDLSGADGRRWTRRAQAAVDVRDSNEDDKYLDNAAFFVVDIGDVDRDLAFQRFEETRGTAGIEKRDDVKFDAPTRERARAS